MNYSLLINTRYTNTQWALYKDAARIDVRTFENRKMSTHFFMFMNDLLTDHAIRFADIRIIGSNRGPAPLTSLRVAHSFINGIACAQPTALIAIESLTHYIDAHQEPGVLTIALFNAFCNDVYFAYYHANELFMGCMNIEQLLTQLMSHHIPVRFIGSGSELYQSAIEQTCGSQALISATIESEIDISLLEKPFLQAVTQASFTQQILPLYFKNGYLQSCPA